MHFSFSKYHAAGNDFIVVDNRQELFPVDDVELIAQLCQRGVGIGANGLVLLQNSTRADYWMRIFNSDGREAEMCGNGLRCLLQYLRDQVEKKECYRIVVGGAIFEGTCDRERISILMDPPTDLSWNIHLMTEKKGIVVHYLNTGVPHTVVFVDDVNGVDVEKEGKEIRWHPVFQPKGANVNFVSFAPTGELDVRTFERGVEGETPACGTGAAAAAYAAMKMHGYRSPVRLRSLSKEFLEVRLRGDGRLQLLGEVSYVFKGRFSQKALCCINV